jgi:two-component system LytT family response regulator
MSEKFHRHHHRFRCIDCGAVVPSCAITRQQRRSDRLIIKVDGRIVFLNACEINWIEADDKYVHLHIGEATYMLRKALVAIEAELDPNRFVRIHRSAIVNVEQIKELQPLFSGEYSILLQDATKLTVSRNHKDKLFELLGKPL